jgi:arsenite-transporting ATPase
MVLAEARRAYTSLCLFGYRVDGVVANRVFPSAGGDPWRERWVTAQRSVLHQVEESFAGLPVWCGAYLPGEPVGAEALTALASDLYAADDPFAPSTGVGPFHVSREADGGAVLHLALPFVTSDQVGLARNGDELVVTVGSTRRLLTLPAGLARLRVAGARVVDGELRVRFRDAAGADPAPSADRPRPAETAARSAAGGDAR